MARVELVYERSCPFVRDTRRRLMEAFRAAGLTPRWTEWETGDPKAPARVRDFGSPTLLVDGRDVAGAPADEAGHCCRIYSLDGASPGVPPLATIVTALTAAHGDPAPAGAAKAPHGRQFAALLPAIGLAALPKLTCPACWPAYAGLMGSLGLGFANYTPYLLPLTGGFLAFSVLALAHRAGRRRGYGPFLLGAAAAMAVLVGKFGYDSDLAMWIGIAVLVGASAWNSWPKRPVDGAAPGAAGCDACTPGDRARA